MVVEGVTGREWLSSTDRNRKLGEDFPLHRAHRVLVVVRAGPHSSLPIDETLSSWDIDSTNGGAAAAASPPILHHHL